MDLLKNMFGTPTVYEIITSLIKLIELYFQIDFWIFVNVVCVNDINIIIKIKLLNY